MKTTANQLENVLVDLESAGGIEMSAIITKDGLLMVSKKGNWAMNTEAFAALTATIHMSAETTTLRINNQKPKSITVETDDKHLITFTAGQKALLVVLVGNTGYNGLIFEELKKAAEKVKKIIERD
jgi:predicted regulator of Ras-like GTPase activity (Roadblock/LC7/MglB family)